MVTVAAGGFAAIAGCRSNPTTVAQDDAMGAAVAPNVAAATEQGRTRAARRLATAAPSSSGAQAADAGAPAAANGRSSAAHRCARAE
jgi:hypothetical protein